MARIRSIKPDFWTDEKVVELSFVDRLLFIGLWNFADDQGLVDDSPKRIKMQVFPADDVDVSAGLARLREAGLLKRFTLASAPESSVFLVRNWERHQRISNPAKPRFDLSDLRECKDAGESSVVLASPLESSVLLGKGREGKGVNTSPLASGFAEFWELYPRKTAKGAAEKAWPKAVKRAGDPDLIVKGLRSLLPTLARSDPQFIPHPASWLNSGRWEDEIPTPVAGQSEEKRRPAFVQPKPPTGMDIHSDAYQEFRAECIQRWKRGEPYGDQEGWTA